jgi:hypothetical protein
MIDYTIADLLRIYTEQEYRTNRGTLISKGNLLFIIHDRLVRDTDYYVRSGVIFVRESGKQKLGIYFTNKQFLKNGKLKL